MPRAGTRGKKGQRRHFTNPQELEAEQEKEARQKKWRQEHGDASSEDENEESTGSSSSSEESDAEDKGKAKGVAHLIEVSNPNRIVKAPVSTEAAPQLSRREREELEKQQARAHYLKLHAAGKTEEARSDLARLTLIRKEREEASRRREMEKKAKEMSKTGTKKT